MFVVVVDVGHQCSLWLSLFVVNVTVVVAVNVVVCRQCSLWLLFVVNVTLVVVCCQCSLLFLLVFYACCFCWSSMLFVVVGCQ